MTICMNIGKYKGVPLKDIILSDCGYVKWYLESVEPLTPGDIKIKSCLVNVDESFYTILNYKNGKSNRYYDIKTHDDYV